jgi:cytochrome c biogenesis protein CcdA/thiol-disulfide isomerase/thioredoxin
VLVLLLFSFISGVVTILSPCILPVLPVLLSGGVGGGRARPFGVIAGFVLSFAFFTLALSAIVQALGVPADALRWVAIAMVALFGLAMLLPALGGALEMVATRIASARGARARGRPTASGFWGGLPLGLSLGLLWTPCVGPIMASVIGLALAQRVDGGSVFITLAYTLGTSLPMLAAMLGGRELLRKAPALSRNAGRIQRGFGAAMLLMALAMGLQWDRKLQTALLAAFPKYGSGLTALETTAPVRAALEARSGRGAAERSAARSLAAGAFAGVPAEAEAFSVLGDFGSAPEFVASGPWHNTGPEGAGSTPSLQSLRGKVVLVDFWTYSCVNCIRTIPYLRAWYSAYRDEGLVIVGVHSPEFAFERSTANVAKAIRDLGVAWPVVQDNDYAQWRAYGNNYWPAHYLIDAKGRVRYWHFGEGEYAKTEGIIKTLLAEAGANFSGAKAPAPGGPPEYALADETPETYLGYLRGSGPVSAVKPIADRPIAYAPARSPAAGEWTLSGTWTIAGEYLSPATTGGAPAILELGFKAKDVYLVVEPADGGGTISLLLDGRKPPATPDVAAGLLRPDSSRLYHLVALDRGGEHRLRLEARGSLRLFAFTFG